jgi:hypothetical protein
LVDLASKMELNGGCPHLDFEMWETMNLNPPSPFFQRAGGPGPSHSGTGESTFIPRGE